MLSHLSIENFAVIKELDLQLHPGLNIITGETGAGKSVVIQAVSMALGSRADTDFIRTGEEKAVVTMTVDGDEALLGEKLRSAGASLDIPVVLKREINSQSRSLCRINGGIVPLSQLSSFCKGVADIHGQYDHQSLLDPENHRDILDLFGTDALREAKEKVRLYYEEFTKASSRLAALKKSLNEAQRQRELLSMEVNDIEAAKLQPGEDDLLEEKISLMQHSEQIYQNLSTAHQVLFSMEGCAYDSLGESLSRLQAVEDLSADIKELSEEIGDIYYRTADLNNQLRRLLDKASFSPAELDEAIERMELINRIKKKFGGSIDAALSYADKARASLKNLENSDELIRDLENALVINRKAYDEWADRLTALRKTTAETLQVNVNQELTELNFKNAIFAVSFQKGLPTEFGSDIIEFLISANKGEDLRPLAKVASGGELSRIMLAMKRIIGDLDGIPTMIFDEIDTGISGATAGIVGEKLRSIAKNHQIICITHLPQIAAMGDYHYLIKKTSDEISTKTTVVPLSEEERIEELARLLSGTEITDTARAQAIELLKECRS